MVSLGSIKKKLGRGNKGKNKEGFLVCEKCGGYYELQPGESPDDFVACECGGDLKHTKKFDVPNQSIEGTDEKITCPFCGTENVGHSKYCQDCGKEISS